MDKTLASFRRTPLKTAQLFSDEETLMTDRITPVRYDRMIASN